MDVRLVGRSVLLLAACLCRLVSVARSCQSVPLYGGVLYPPLELERLSLSGRPAATACSCCGLCHQRPACRSLSFSRASQECVLYSTVGGPADLLRQTKNNRDQYFFLPGRSLTNEFCRSDSDCTTAGDSCRARICTTDTTVTCRDLYRLNGDLLNAKYWTHVGGRDLVTECRRWGEGGYTLLLRSTSWNGWTIDNRLNWADTTDHIPRMGKFSILWAADSIRNSSEDSSYSVLVAATKYYNQGSDDPSQRTRDTQAINFTARREVSLPGSRPTPSTYTTVTGAEPRYGVSFPYVTDTGDNLLHINANSASEYGALIRRNGAPLKWTPSFKDVDFVQLYIRE